MSENKSWQGVNFTTPKQVSGRDSMRTFSRNDGKEMAEITLPNGEKKDVSFHKFIVPKTSEQQVEKSKSKKGAYLAPDTPVEDTSSETKERTKQKSTSLREATKEAKAASEQLSKEAKSAPAKETISIDNGVSL